MKFFSETSRNLWDYYSLLDFEHPSPENKPHKINDWEGVPEN